MVLVQLHIWECLPAIILFNFVNENLLDIGELLDIHWVMSCNGLLDSVVYGYLFIDKEYRHFFTPFPICVAVAWLPFEFLFNAVFPLAIL